MSTYESLLVPNRTKGWRMGLANMLSMEFASWLRTRRWWIQGLLALLLFNVSLALNLKNMGSISNAVTGFLSIATFGVPIVAISLTQDAILGEKHSGTAAWVLSKPLCRSAFILAKLIALGLGLLVIWVVLPGIIAYLEFSVLGKVHPPELGFAGVMGLIYLNLLFYVMLALMLATLFNGRGPVLGIAVSLLYGWLLVGDKMLLRLAPWLDAVMPWRLLVKVGDDAALAGYLLQGQPLPTLAPIIATVLWCALFVGVAIWRFRREEF